MFKILVLISVLFAHLGCAAVSGLSKEPSIKLEETNSGDNDKNISIEVVCFGPVYSMMVSPFIPLPPIIPVFWSNFNVSLKAPQDYKILKISISDNIPLEFGATHKTDTGLSHIYHSNKSCTALRGEYIILEMEKQNDKNETRRYKIIYSDDGLKLDWDYSWVT